MSYNKLLVVLSFVMLSQASIVACASTEDKEASKPSVVYYSNCGVVNLEGTNGINMTKEERIAAEESTLFDALDENNECSKKALVTGQQAVAAAGAASGGSGSNDGNQGQGTAGINGLNSADGQHQSSGESSHNSDNQTNQQATEQVISSTSGVGGDKSGVNGQEITVCQISRENLTASTTPEDKAFWQGEVDKNCK